MISSPAEATDLRLCTAGEFSDLVRGEGGRHIPLDGDQRTSKLAPLEVLAGTGRLVADPDDVGYLSREAAETVRVVPRALFACPEVALYGSGVAAVGGKVCGRTLRTEKFLRKAAQQFDEAQHRPKLTAFSDSEQPALLIAPLEHFNYSHWILEGVPKLGLFEKAYGKMPETAVIVGSASPFHAASIAYVSASTKLRRVKSTPARLANVCFTTSLARSVAEIDPQVFEFYDAVLREKFAGAAPDRLRLYVSRANAGHRRVENEDELVRALAKLGFVVLDPGAHPFEAQAAMFWRAEAVVGAHGAGLANLAFAPNCRFALELLSSGFRDGSVYAHICRHRGIAYGAASGEPVEKEVAGPRDPEGWPGHRSFRVDTEALLRELKGLL